MKTSFISLVLLALVACIQGNVSDDIVAHEAMNFPVPTVASVSNINCEEGVPVFTTSTHTTFDLSDYFIQLQKQGTLTVQFNESYLTGDLSSFIHAILYISHAGSSQSFLLAETDFTSVNGKVELPLILNQQALLLLIEGGAVDIQVTLSACPPSQSYGNLSIDYTLGATVSLSVNKSL